MHPRITHRPQGRDPVAVIAADPGSLIDMEAAGMPSTLEFN
jgi:hypothetical protein